MVLLPIQKSKPSHKFWVARVNGACFDSSQVGNQSIGCLSLTRWNNSVKAKTRRLSRNPSKKMQSNLLSTVILFIILGIIQMNSQSFYFCSFLTLFFSLILIHAPQGSTNPEFYQTCGNTYSCGDITGLSYPFRSVNDPPFCGYPGFELNCNQDSSTTMVIKNMKYRIVDVFPTTQTIRIVREDIMESTCPVDLVKTTLDYSLFDYAAGYTNLTFLYNCPVSSYSAETDVIACRNSKYHNVFVLPGAVGPGKCNASVTVPVLQVSAATVGSLNSSGLGQLIQEGFDIRWKIDSKACSKCTEKKGRCVYDEYMKQTTCFCPDSPYESASCSVDAFGFSPPLPISIPSPSPDDEPFRRCGESFSCGDIDINYPFWGGGRPKYCGGHPSLEINCESDILSIAIESTTYKVIAINNFTRIVTLARDDLLSNICLDNPEKTSMDLNTFSYVSTDQNITLYYGCTLRSGSQIVPTFPNVFKCNSNIFGIYTLIDVSFDFSLVTCRNEIIARVNQTNAVALVSDTASVEVLRTAISGGFSVNWTAASFDSKCQQCDKSGGRCGSNPDSATFSCHCVAGTHPTDCNDGHNQAGARVNQTNAVALVSDTASVEVLRIAISGGFSVNWTAASFDSKCQQCDKSGGRCGSNLGFAAFSCHCVTGTHPTDCNDRQNQAGGNLFSTIPS
ncbi:hypothetical protein RND71_011762 [Anisodus tanguticus]|uniref:non-specific serine/threonine protein kinase n=1 Tax=Anisodus tanguticus TaxID=243964 RepID=A0AAE1SDW8_9SOLA|nr:hypothetical protein RND71_011762 [Anisodus tanguticus]